VPVEEVLDGLMTGEAFDTVSLDAPLGGTPDPTQVNQLGIQISTSTCP